jgi:peptidoglycan/LPS O-acetylase OafA/YrhL
VATALVIAALVWAPAPIVERVLGARPSQWVARISYSLYLWHVVIYRAVDVLLPHERARITIPCKVIASLVVATLSWRLVERPWLRRRDAVVSRGDDATVSLSTPRAR